MRAGDAAGAARGLGTISACRLVPSVVPVQTLASGAPDAVRWAATVARALFMREDTKECTVYFNHHSCVKTPKNVLYRSAIFPA